MTIRAAHRPFNFPFVYDAERQLVSRAHGPVATPHVFVFDGERKLRSEGRVDSNPREAYAKVADTRHAIDALLAGGKVARREDPDGSAARSKGSASRPRTRSSPPLRRSR